MATADTVVTPTAVDCTICGHHHPREDSVTVDPPGLSAGLACLPTGVRRLLGLPEPGDAAIGASTTPPCLSGWDPRPSNLFTVELAQLPGETDISQEHFRQALDQMGLSPILRAEYASSNCSTSLLIDGRDITFTFSAYTAAPGHLHIWSEALTYGNQPEIMGMARLTWAQTSSDDDYEAYKRAVEFVSRSRHTGPREEEDEGGQP